MSNGESVLINIRKMVENGEELSVREFRIFMLSTAIDGEKKRVTAAIELKQIKKLVYDKNEELKDKIQDLENKDSCIQADTNKEEIDRLRDEEIPALRSSSRISDGILGFLALVGAYLASSIKQ